MIFSINSRNGSITSNLLFLWPPGSNRSERTNWSCRWCPGFYRTHGSHRCDRATWCYWCYWCRYNRPHWPYRSSGGDGVSRFDRAHRTCRFDWIDRACRAHGRPRFDRADGVRCNRCQRD